MSTEAQEPDEMPVLEALLSIDLGDANASARSAFAASLSEAGWEAVSEVQNTWTASLEDMNRQEAMDETDDDLAEAGRQSGIGRYRAAVQFSPEAPWLLESDD